jgi:mannan endo-1,4-beta-mannosidase
VYNFLQDNYGKKTISGAMANVSWNTNEAQWVYKHTGIYPALNCFDYIHLQNSPSSWINYNNTTIVQNWWKANGLVAIMWHWNVPRSQSSSDYSFNTRETTFDITKAVQPGTYENGVVMADLEKAANCLLLLKRANIPVIWRPLHEASGGWFWWGAKGPEAYKALWKLMFETFQAKGLNNLIWVWTSETNDDAWYPGDQYVDIVGRDLYNKRAASQANSDFQKLKTAYSGKLIALSEFGNVATISEQWKAGATWSWFMAWYDYERTNNVGSAAFNETTHQHADIAFWQSAFADPLVISRDEMPSLK